jgi:hypothetical protein
MDVPGMAVGGEQLPGWHLVIAYSEDLQLLDVQPARKSSKYS